MRDSSEEAVPALELVSRRRYLGYIIFFVNLPLLLWNMFDSYQKLAAGMRWNSAEFAGEAIIIAISLGMTFVLPYMTPVFRSRYWLTDEGLKISRFLKGTVTIPYPSIARAELHVKNERDGEPSPESMQYSREAASELRRSGFKFADYTNDDATIVLLITESRVYLLSPKYPKAFAQKLRKRVGKLPVKMVELAAKGKRVRQI